ncbi:DUF4870 domain-containing protein [Sphingobacterium sp. MYb382]|uniref:DUF4870 domain-containing protein n=1 Tax=Sphingobacterium sp. MYb382 TaxID=2745278 RepID=UPI0030AC74FC
MDNKTLAIVSYITLIGWLVSYFNGKEKANGLLKYHLRQSLGLLIVSIIINVLLNIVVVILPSLSVLMYVSVLFFVLLIIGIINAANEVEKPLPIIGKMFEGKFAFIG